VYPTRPAAPPNRNSNPDRRWYHNILTTYGAWLPGDSRGFRTRHHREHVEGDYKNPPVPGEHGSLEEVSRESLKCSSVSLLPTLRASVGTALLERLEGSGALVVCVAVSAQHVHVLAKMPRGCPRHWLGIAKRHAWFVLRDRGWEGKLWGKRSKQVEISNRQHQLRVYRYVLNHAAAGAWIWKWSDRV